VNDKRIVRTMIVCAALSARGHHSRGLLAIVTVLLAMLHAPASAADHGLDSCAATPATVSRGQSVSHRAVLRFYDDGIHDVVSAPDICTSNFVTNDNRRITIGLHVYGRSSFSWSDVYSIYLDTDSNAATGSDAASGAPPGAEYGVDIANRRTYLLRWNGSSFDAVIPRIPIATSWLDGVGPALQVARDDLGDPQSFNFVVVTTNNDRDLAPDTGTWSYELSPSRSQPDDCPLVQRARASASSLRCRSSGVTSRSHSAKARSGARRGLVDGRSMDAERSDGSVSHAPGRCRVTLAARCSQAGSRSHSRASQ